MAGAQVTLTIPNEAPPGTLLSVAVRNDHDKIKVRVPEGMGAGSTVIVQQMERSDEWDVRIGTVVPVAAEDRSNVNETYLREQAALEQAWREQQQQQKQGSHEHVVAGPAPMVVREVSDSPNSIEYVSCHGMQLPIVAEHRLRTLHISELMEHAEFLYRTFGHERLGVAPPEKYEEVLSWVVQVQNLHIEPQRLVDPGPLMEGAVAYTVRLDTTVGVIEIIVRPDWAPAGTQRFLELAAAGDLNDLAFYRAVKGCIVQFGLPAKRHWPAIPDDPPTGVPFLLGAVSFAAVGQNSRKSTLFICIGDMSHCLGQNSWETPIGAVAENSLDVLDNIETTYGDIAEFNGEGPDTTRINNEGNSYLRRDFPRLSYIQQAQTLDWFPETPLQLEPLTSIGAESSSYPAPPQNGARSPRNAELPPCAPSWQEASRGQPTDQVTIAALAAREAHAQAQLAEQLAQQAATANQAAFASQAAQAAQAAAEAAKAAMRAAQAVQAQQQLDVAERREESEREVRSEVAVETIAPSRQEPIRQEPEVAYRSSSTRVGATEGARVRAFSPQRGFSGPARSIRKVMPTPANGASNIVRPESVDVPVEIVRSRAPIPAPVQRINSFSPAVLPGIALEAARDPRMSVVPPPMIPHPAGGSGSIVMSTASYTPIDTALALTPTRTPKASQVQPIAVSQPTVNPWVTPTPLLPAMQQVRPIPGVGLPLGKGIAGSYHSPQASRAFSQQPVIGVSGLTR